MNAQELVAQTFDEGGNFAGISARIGNGPGGVGTANPEPDPLPGTSREQDEVQSTDISSRRVYKGPFPDTSSGYYSLVQPMWRRCFVYVLFDWADNVLYVGKSFRPGNRFDRHRRRDWWPDVSTVAILQIDGPERHEVERAAYNIELNTIHSLRPLHNVTGVIG